MLSKLVILGKPRSQPNKILKRAKTIGDLKEMVKGQDAALANHFRLSLSGDNLIDAVFRSIHDRRFLLFAIGLSDKEYDPDRFESWMAFRKENKTVSIGEEYWKVKYGDHWESHAKEYRDNKPNPYSVDHWITRHGYDKNQALDKIKRLKMETSMPLERCIQIHGESEGRRRHAHQHRFHLNYDEAWNGNLEGKKRYTRETNRCTVEHWIKRGYSEDDAKIKISQSQKMYSGLHKEYWRRKGLSEDQIDELWGIINSRKDGSSLSYFKKRYGEEYGEELYVQHCLVKSSCYREHGKLAEDLYPGLKGYQSEVNRHTRASSQLLGPCPGKRGRYKGCYQIDHKFSVIEGYKQNVDPKIIGSVCNLEWITTEENTSKKGICSISLDALKEDYENHKNS